MTLKFTGVVTANAYDIYRRLKTWSRNMKICFRAYSWPEKHAETWQFCRLFEMFSRADMQILMASRYEHICMWGDSLSKGIKQFEDELTHSLHCFLGPDFNIFTRELHDYNVWKRRLKNTHTIQCIDLSLVSICFFRCGRSYQLSNDWKIAKHRN